MVVRRIWTWLVVKYRTFSNLEICKCRLSNKIPNMSSWWLDCSCWVLVVYSSGVMGEAISVCTDVAKPWPDGVAWGKDSLLGALEEWLLLSWRDIMDNGWRRASIFPCVGGRTPSRTMIFIRNYKKEDMFGLLFKLLFSQWSEKCEHRYQSKLRWWDHIGIVLFQNWWSWC